MTRNWLIFIAFTLAAFCGPLAPPVAGQTPANSYTVVQLGGFGGLQTTAYGLNDSGQVVGRSDTAVLDQHAFIWQDGVMTDLGTLGGSAAIAYSINNAGQVVGKAATAAGNFRAFLWSAGTGMRDLGTLGGAESEAYGVDDAGQVVGMSYMVDGSQHAFLWQDGQMVDLGGPTGYLSSAAYGINASGKIVGEVRDASGQRRAFRWSPTVPNGTSGTMAALQASADSVATGINGSGEAAGWAQEFGGATLWDTAGDGYALPLLPDAAGGYASAINDSRVVVGSAIYTDGDGNFSESAFVWDTNGTRQLSALVDGFWYFTGAPGINASGQVATHNYSTSYLLTPSPLPSQPLYLSASGGDTQVSLSWSASFGADSYIVKRAAPGEDFAVLTSVTGTTYTDTAVVNGTTYSYSVSAVNAYGESQPAYTSATPVGAPTGLTATAGEWQVYLSWNSSAGASNYNVYRSETSGGPYAWISYADVTNFLDDRVTGGTTYYYVVTAGTPGGESGYSNEASARPGPIPPAAPTALTATAPTAKKQIALKWTQSSSAGVIQNRIYRSTTSGGTYSLRATISATTSYKDTSLTSGVTYYYVVTAVSSNGRESVYSDQATAKAR